MFDVAAEAHSKMCQASDVGGVLGSLFLCTEYSHLIKYSIAQP